VDATVDRANVAAGGNDAFTRDRWLLFTREHLRPEYVAHPARLAAFDRLIADRWLRNRWGQLAADVRAPWVWQLALGKLVFVAVFPPRPAEGPDLSAVRRALQAFQTLTWLAESDRALLSQIWASGARKGVAPDEGFNPARWAYAAGALLKDPDVAMPLRPAQRVRDPERNWLALYLRETVMREFFRRPHYAVIAHIVNVVLALPESDEIKADDVRLMRPYQAGSRHTRKSRATTARKSLTPTMRR